MSKLVDNHPLARDLPEYKTAIKTMKSSNAHFAKAMKLYEELDKQIVRLEQQIVLADDLELDDLKMKRVQSKDYLVEMLRAVV